MNSRLTKSPNRASAIHNSLERAVSLFSSGQPREALSTVIEVLERNPNNGMALNIAGVCAHSIGRLEDAEHYWRRALTENPANAEVYNNLGILLKDAKRFPEAEEAYGRALEIRSDYFDAYANLGSLLKEVKRFAEAEAAYRRALEIQPGYAKTHNNLGNLLYEMKRFTEAEAAYRQALAIRPDYAEAHCNLGHLLFEAKRFPEAEAAYRRALEIRPDHINHSNLGTVLYEAKRFTEAEAAYLHALEIRPDYAEARWNLGLLLLHAGRFSEGWPLYEVRFDEKNRSPITRKPAVDYPQWHGESLKGKSITVHCEQGFGDAIQFVRYLPLLKALGARHITLICRQPLRALFDGIDGVEGVHTPDELASLPVHDYWTLLLSLPLHLATTLDSIPAAIPYLRSTADRLDAWKARLPAPGLRIGLVWKGNPTHENDSNRSLPSLTALSPLWEVPGLHFVSLQKGQGDDEASIPPPGQPLTHLGTDIADFADSAAIIAQLDLVICVDTAIGHLAGALGKPCWILLPHVGTDWRWLEERADSPWYPETMRLFRQRHPDDWAPTILDVAEALHHFAKVADAISR